jgi:HK97 family phage prohead protease
MKHEQKVFAMAIKAMTDDGPGKLSALVSAKNNIDRVGDVIVDGAYSNLGDTVKNGFGAVGHNWEDLPVATIDDAKEVPEGLLFDMTFHSHQAAQDARSVVKERMDRGKSVAMSIGYTTLESTYETRNEKEVRVLKSIEVFEASIVTVPANPLALARSAKGLLQGGMSLDDHIAVLLDGAGDLSTRIKALAGDRGYISQSRRDALKSVIDELTELYGVSVPKTTPDEASEKAHQIMVRHLELRHAGVI